MSNIIVDGALLKLTDGAPVRAVPSVAENLAYQGRLFRYSLDYSYAAAQERLFSVTAPAGYLIAVLYRTVSADSAGVEYAKMAGTVAPDSAQVVGYNTLDDSVSAANIRLLGTPTVAGTVRRVPVYLGAGGGNSPNRGSGTATSDQGFDIILPGVTAISRVKNQHTAANRIIVELGLAFIPV